MPFFIVISRPDFSDQASEKNRVDDQIFFVYFLLALWMRFSLLEVWQTRTRLGDYFLRNRLLAVEIKSNYPKHRLLNSQISLIVLDSFPLPNLQEQKKQGFGNWLNYYFFNILFKKKLLMNKKSVNLRIK